MGAPHTGTFTSASGVFVYGGTGLTPEHQGKKTYLSYVVVRSQLDYLFFRCHGHHKATYWRADQRYGSDHYPVMGFIRVG